MTEERRPGPNTRLFAAALCPSCQFSFIATAPVEVCPECGRRLDLDAGASCETQLHQRAGASDDPTCVTPKASQAREVDELIGQRIDCYSCDALLGAGAM